MKDRRNYTVIEALVGDRRLNAALAWVLTGFVALAAAGSLMGGDSLWTLFAICVAILAVMPMVAFRSVYAVLPWEVLVLAVLPLFGRTFGSGAVGELAMYLSVAAIALIVAVELQAFTSVRMTPGFAVVLVVIVTMATAGVWAVVRWAADLYLGTGFLGSEEALMWEFVASTVAGVVAGVVFEGYFRRRLRSKDGRAGGGDPT